MSAAGQRNREPGLRHSHWGKPGTGLGPFLCPVWTGDPASLWQVTAQGWQQWQHKPIVPWIIPSGGWKPCGAKVTHMPWQGDGSQQEARPWEEDELQQGEEAVTLPWAGAGPFHLTWQEPGEAGDKAQDPPLPMFNILEIILSTSRV